MAAGVMRCSGNRGMKRVGRAVRKCGCDYRQARLCPSVGALQDVWMTAADAAIRLFFKLGGVCYYFNFSDATSATPGTVYPASAATAFTSCGICTADPYVCKHCGPLYGDGLECCFSCKSTITLHSNLTQPAQDPGGFAAAHLVGKTYTLHWMDGCVPTLWGASSDWMSNTIFFNQGSGAVDPTTGYPGSGFNSGVAFSVHYCAGTHAGMYVAMHVNVMSGLDGGGHPIWTENLQVRWQWYYPPGDGGTDTRDCCGAVVHIHSVTGGGGDSPAAFLLPMTYLWTGDLSGDFTFTVNDNYCCVDADEADGTGCQKTAGACDGTCDEDEGI